MNFPEQNLSRNLMEYSCRASFRLGFAYFSNAKAACSTIQTTLLKYEKDLGLQEHYPESGLNTTGYKYFQNDLSVYKNLSSFFKFTFVRNPYSRILSAYLDKMLNREDNTHKHILKLFPQLEENLTFTGFLKCIAALHPEQMNPHWRPQIYNIMYGFVPYDAFGFIENMNDDFDGVCEKIFGDSSSIVQMKRHSVNAVEKCKKYFSEEDIALVDEIYHEDFQFLNYKKDIDLVAVAPSEKPVCNFNGHVVKRFAQCLLDFDAKRYDVSLFTLAKLEKELPRNPFIPELAGKCLLQQNELDAALEKADHAHALVPNLPSPKTLRARIVTAQDKAAQDKAAQRLNALELLSRGLRCFKK